MGVGGQRHTPATFYPRERPGTHYTGGWVGQRVCLEGYGKSRPSPGFDLRTVQLVASRYIPTELPGSPPLSRKKPKQQQQKIILKQISLE
jgi:hypothetical protein